MALRMAASRCRSATSSTKLFRVGRSYSSAPLKSAAGTLYTACKRVNANAELLSTYDNELQLFPADLNPAARWWTMVQLHMPAQTHVELPEFLEGAKAASKAYLKAILSKEFSHFAAGLTHESAAAAELAAYCTPQDYDLWKRAMAYMVKDTNMTLDLLDVELQSAAVASVRYVQLTQTEYEAQTAGPTTLPWLWAPDATIEYMQIRVTTRSLDTMKITLTGQGERVVLQDNTHTWTFGSKVGSPDELDWRIVATGDKNNDEKTLSHTVYADEADDTREKEALDSEEKA